MASDRRSSIKDRRAGGRRQDLRYTARIESLADGTEIPCTLLDVSQTGARLVAREPELVPDEFLLRLAVGRQALRHCAVVWRDGANIGVRFIVAPDPEP
ncbi:PilZ domain-containing protein [Phreatobacter sp. HK31-P]